ncbi:MAG: hypothetical protein AAF235_00795 [Planctomycetota bacterium]
MLDTVVGEAYLIQVTELCSEGLIKRIEAFDLIIESGKSAWLGIEQGTSTFKQRPA